MTENEKRGWETGAVLLLGAVVVSNIKGGLDSLLEKLGFKKSSEEKKIDETSSNPLSPWSPLFWQTGVEGTKLLREQDVVNLIDQIKSAYHGFLTTDHSEVIAAFKSLETQSQLSYLVYKFSQLEGIDLLSWLRDSDILWTWPYHRLSDEEIGSITDYISKLPKYK